MTELALSLELQADSECGLLRALTLLHRRRCRVLEARYVTRPGAPERLSLRVQAPPRHAHCLEAWLSSLIDVRAVRAQVSATGARAGSGTSGSSAGSSPERMTPA
jgi:hypothetical protein